MGRGVVKVAVGRSGGADHVAYITRELALVGELSQTHDDASHTGHPRTENPPHIDAPSVQPEQHVPLAHRSESVGEDVSPIWTWNAPVQITGEGFGGSEFEARYAETRERSGGHTLPGRITDDARQRDDEMLAHLPADLSLSEQHRNSIAHFGGLADYEEHLGGVSHLRIIFSVPGAVDNRQLRTISLSFLQGSFPQGSFPISPALVTVHRDTDHIHVHIHISSRDLHERRLSLGQEYFHLDERLLAIAAHHLRDSEMLDEHLRLKAETQLYKRGVKEDRAAGRPIRPKPDRHSDHWEVEHGRVRPFDDNYAGRIEHAVEVATARVEYARLRGDEAAVEAAAKLEVEQRRRDVLLGKQAEIYTARRKRAKSAAKREPVRSVPTVGEQKELQVLRGEIERLKREKREQMVREVEAKLRSLEREYFAETKDVAGAEWALNENKRNDRVAELTERKLEVFERDGGGRLLAEAAGYTREKIARGSQRAVEEEAKRQTAVVEREAAIMERQEEMQAVVNACKSAFIDKVSNLEEAFWGYDAGRVAQHTKTLHRELEEEFARRGWTPESANLDADYLEQVAVSTLNNKETHHYVARHWIEYMGGQTLRFELLKGVAERSEDKNEYESLARRHTRTAEIYRELAAKGRRHEVEGRGLVLDEHDQAELIAVRAEIPEREWDNLMDSVRPDVRQSMAAGIKRAEKEQRRERQKLEAAQQQQRREQELKHEQEQQRKEQELGTRRVGEPTRATDPVTITQREEVQTETKQRERERERERSAPILIR